MSNWHPLTHYWCMSSNAQKKTQRRITKKYIRFLFIFYFKNQFKTFLNIVCKMKKEKQKWKQKNNEKPKKFKN